MADLIRSMACIPFNKILLRKPIGVLAMILFAFQPAFSDYVDPAYFRLDSLESALERAKEQTERAAILIQLADEWSSQDQDKAMLYATEATQTASANQDSSLLLDAKIMKADLLVNYQQSYPAGIKLLNQSLELARSLQQHAKELRVLNMLGYVHSRMDSYNLAHQYFQLALTVATTHGFEDSRTNILLRIAEVLEYEGKPEEASAYYNSVLEKESQNDFANTSPENLVYLGHHYQVIQDHEKALDLFQRSIPKFEESGNPRWSAYVWSQIALEEYAQGDYSASLKSGEKGLEIAEQNALTKELADNHANLSTIHDSLGNFQKALYHFKAYHRVNNEMYSVEKAAQFASIQAQHELVLKELSLKQTEVENELQSNRVRILYGSALIVFFLVVVIVYFAYRRYRLKKNINLQLEGRGELKNLSMSEVIKQLRFEVEDHQETREQLEKSNEELSHFLYKSSHDLRGPLVSILGLISLTEMENTTDTERDHYLNLIRTSTTRISHKLDSLLHATRLKDKPLELEPVNLHVLVKETIEDLLSKEESPAVEVLVDVTNDLTITTDKVLMQTLIFNLVENGIRFRNPERDPAQVWVSVRLEGNNLILKVRDNGVGIPESEREKVFEMFVRSDFKRGGSGLGLYLVQKIVEKLDGKIDLQSKVGDGTSVKVTLA